MIKKRGKRKTRKRFGKVKERIGKLIEEKTGAEKKGMFRVLNERTALMCQYPRSSE